MPTPSDTPGTGTTTQIRQREVARGSQSWTGPTGAADAFALMGQVWNVTMYGHLTSLYTSVYQLERI